MCRQVYGRTRTSRLPPTLHYILVLRRRRDRCCGCCGCCGCFDCYCCRRPTPNARRMVAIAAALVFALAVGAAVSFRHDFRVIDFSISPLSSVCGDRLRMDNAAR